MSNMRPLGNFFLERVTFSHPILLLLPLRLSLGPNRHGSFTLSLVILTHVPQTYTFLRALIRPTIPRIIHALPSPMHLLTLYCLTDMWLHYTASLQ